MEETTTQLSDSLSAFTIRTCLTVAEVHDVDTDEVLLVTFALFDEYGTAWFGTAPNVRKYDLSDEDYRRLLKRIPDEQAYPLVPPGLSVCHLGDLDDYHIKRANLIGFDDVEVAKLLPEILLEEAKVLEFLKQHTHPNLVEYYGCIVKGERIAGLVLKKYPTTLQRSIDCGLCEFGASDATSWVTGLRAGVQHLHSLGFAHNDLNPANIALDDQGNVVVLDFGSCKRFGEELISAGTSGWFDESNPDWAISAQAHDDFAIRKIESWLDGKLLLDVSKAQELVLDDHSDQ